MTDSHQRRAIAESVGGFARSNILGAEQYAHKAAAIQPPAPPPESAITVLENALENRSERLGWLINRLGNIADGLLGMMATEAGSPTRGAEKAIGRLEHLNSQIEDIGYKITILESIVSRLEKI